MSLVPVPYIKEIIMSLVPVPCIQEVIMSLVPVPYIKEIIISLVPVPCIQEVIVTCTSALYQGGNNVTCTSALYQGGNNVMLMLQSVTDSLITNQFYQLLPFQWLMEGLPHLCFFVCFVCRSWTFEHFCSFLSDSFSSKSKVLPEPHGPQGSADICFLYPQPDTSLHCETMDIVLVCITRFVRLLPQLSPVLIVPTHGGMARLS